MSFDDVTRSAIPESAEEARAAADSTETRGADDVRPASESIGAADDAVWHDVLEQAVDHDFHHLAGYHRLAEHRGEGAALLFAYREQGYLIALPLLLRPVDEGDPAGLQDATSVYGYAGPLASHRHIPEPIIGSFQAALRHELLRRRVIAVFSRLHPLIAQEHLLAGLGQTRSCGLTVSVDLTLSPEDQWAGYSKGTRRLIRRAEEAGATCIHDPDLAQVEDWTAIYEETMQRVGAPPSYRFDLAYFRRLKAELGPVLHLFVVRVDGRAAAAGLFTLCHGIVQAHLGGSRTEYAAISPARLVDDTARRWAVEAGARVFHLGGGVGGREDSLFQYKAGFSARRHRFATWRWVVDPAAYRDLCEQRQSSAPDATGSADDDFFPAYRRPLPGRP